MKVINELRILEINDKEVSSDPKLIVKSHWNYHDRVVLELPTSDGSKRLSIVLMSDDLMMAIKNSGNWPR